MDKKPDSPPYKAAPASAASRERADVGGFFAAIRRDKLLVMAVMAVSVLLGCLSAYSQKPYYKSQAVLAPKDMGKGSPSSLLSQMSGIGGLMALGLGGGNSNLNHLEVIARSRSISEAVITRKDFLPRIYSENWLAKEGKWKDETKAPKLEKAAERLRSQMLQTNMDSKKSILTLSITARDPALASEIAREFIVVLNERIKSDVVNDSKLNIEYLEAEAAKTYDPTIKEKILSMIAFEIEKGMLVTSQSFTVLEFPMVPVYKAGPNRKGIVVAAAFLGALLAAFIVALKLIRKDTDWARLAGRAE